MSISFDELRQQHFDPDVLLNAISGSMMEQRILAGGEMNVHLRRLVVGDLTINSGDYSFPLFANGGFSHGHVHIGLLTSASDEVLVNQRVIPLDQLQLYAPDCELHYATHAGAGWAVIELPLERLQTTAIAYGYGELDWPRQGVRHIDLHPKVAQCLRQEICSLLRLGKNLANSPDTGVTESLACEGLVQLLSQGITAQYPASQPRHRLTAGQRRALETLEICIDRWKFNPADGLQLKHIKDTSERMLERATREAYGVTPHYWLKLVRLNAAHRDLLHGSCTSVIEVCERWGFGHAGRFAMDYRALFGKSPSAILKRL